MKRDIKVDKGIDPRSCDLISLYALKFSIIWEAYLKGTFSNSSNC